MKHFGTMSAPVLCNTTGASQTGDECIVHFAVEPDATGSDQVSGANLA